MLSFLERLASARTTELWLPVLLYGVGSNEQDLNDLTLHVAPQFHVQNTFRARRSRCATPIFPGGHEIWPAEMQAAMQWLEVIRG